MKLNGDFNAVKYHLNNFVQRIMIEHILRLNHNREFVEKMKFEEVNFDIINSLNSTRTTHTIDNRGLNLREKEHKINLINSILEYNNAQTKICEKLIEDFEKNEFDKCTNEAVEAWVLKENILLPEKFSCESDLEIIQRSNYLMKVHNDDKHKLYLVSSNVQKHSNLINFEKINIDWFRNIKSQSSTYILNKKEFFRFHINQGKEICVIHFCNDPYIPEKLLKMFKDPRIADDKLMYGFLDCRYMMFTINLEEEKYSVGFDNDISFYEQRPLELEKFLKLLLFVELSKPEVVYVKNNEKIKSPEEGKADNDEHKIKNESGVGVNAVFVNKSWQKIIINDSGFMVRGHYRMQACGEGWKSSKLIWVEGFQKKGYTRGLSKDRDLSNGDIDLNNPS